MHPTHGAGIVTGKRTFTIDGRKTHYLCIELKDTANSQVMTPIKTMEERGLREADGTFALIREVMLKQPRELDADHRTRQADIRSRISEGGLRHIIQGLRDLYWREFTEHLTNTDKRLRMALDKKLQQEMAVTNNISKAVAKQRISQIIQAAMETHAANMVSVVV